MAKFAIAFIPKLSSVNWLKLATFSLVGISALILVAITLFGKVDSALPKVSLNIPSLADSSKIQAGLRSDKASNTQNLIQDGQQEEPRLSGISDPSLQPVSLQPNNTRRLTQNEPRLPTSPNALVAVPIAGFFEPGPGGVLPIISAGGDKPSTVYSRSFEIKKGKPVVSIIVGGLGMMKRTTMAAIEELPPEVTLSFVPYTPDLQTWIDLARAQGHEVMIEIPMEPFGYPETDPGPYTLLSSASSAENTRRLEWLLSRTSGYFGVTNYMGSKLTASENALAPIFRNFNRRGLDFLYDGETRRSSLKNVAVKEGLSWSTADRIIDIKQTTTAIDDQLLRLEAMAIQNGSAIGKGFSWPVTIKQLRDWTASLEAKGYQLAPVSAVIKMRNEEVESSSATLVVSAN
ncbi:MAG: divergent polysaccharide deacetylase family protein [Robiginitomaculum sp.]|nr:divergent polysaccharide deacetylase family protein [Robiginitomaculum sp.]